MGLAGAKNRQKLSADPNNTNWSRDTDRFGHKILTSQGWSPGQYLGAKDAAHSAHYSAANASHIRVAVKDDNLGLGAKRGKAENDTFGLSLFQGVLGRLNGKSDVELKKEENTQRDMKLALYQGQRWGMMNFVSGGFLVGDKIENLKKLEGGKAGSTPEVKETAKVVEESPQSERSGGKRKRSESSESSSSSDTPSLKRKKRKSNLQAEFESDKVDGKAEKKKSKKSKKTAENGAEDSKVTGSGSTSSDEKAERKRRKAEKKARKEAKKEKKAAKLEKKESKKRDKEQRKQEKTKKADSSSDSSSESETEVAASKPAAPVAAPVNFGGSRLAVRQRYIRQKKMASMDPQALKEIFMVKAEA
ncbi:hypothetical protein K490DRAFT_71014 [Saccharata proteae CBS 121410]|uniref:PinX1-related protein 1 n=1 Tax=Saccharata proteae CBS 121410 TaxID=1314787 RepID=A0A9P4HZY1_9PEZI|nr:hypothetical protein K490DRAFT_71014 [Saccharata proteae CBS 121410]